MVEQSTILVVDDNEQNIELLEAMLIPQGYRIISARDGLEALEIVEQETPHIILLDVMMPRMDGFEVTRHLRANPKTKGTPILILTALRDLSHKVRGLELGADDFLSKPFKRVELLARVRSLLRIKHLHDELEKKNALLHQVLTRYVAEEVANQILSNPEEHFRLGGQTIRVSVMFADIRGFTRFSEHREAQEVLRILNTVWNRLVPLIFELKGTFDKYLGDAIMALYGAPISLGNDQLRAVQSAIAMQQEFDALMKQNTDLAQLGLGIGIFTGDAVVGNAGSEQMMDYTAIGNTPNMAHRLQENARSGQILICESTYHEVKEHIQAYPIESLLVKGRSEPLPVYQVYVPPKPSIQGAIMNLGETPILRASPILA